MAISNKPISQEEPKFLDEILLQLAADEVQTEVLAFPRHLQGVGDYEKFTARDLDRFVDATVKHLIASGLNPGKHEPVGIFAHSGVAWAVTAFALSRLGYSVFLLSLRLGPAAIAHLATRTESCAIIHGVSDDIEQTITAVHKMTGIKTLPIVSRDVYDVPISGPRFALDVNSPGRDPNAVFIISHSSGSTGFPKPVFYAKSERLQSLLQADADYETFVSRPLYYGWSFITLLQTIYRRKICYLFNTAVPMTAENMTTALVAANADRVQTTPYNLELMSSTSTGVEALKAARMVSVGGAHLSDELGERLTAQGVHLNNMFGSGEAGLLGGSGDRPVGDPTWDYIRFLPWVKEHVHMEPCRDDPSGLTHELIYLPSYVGLVAHNSDYPVPGSYRTKDIFARHPTLADAWKFVARADDMITLSNGCNVTPLTLEADVRGSSALVRDAVVFGIQRSTPGLLIFRDKAANDSADENGIIAQGIVKDIWPAVERQNALVEDVAQIPVRMIRVLPVSAELPVTDKGNAIRSKVYKEFAKEIDELYDSK